MPLGVEAPGMLWARGVHGAGLDPYGDTEARLAQQRRALAPGGALAGHTDAGAQSWQGTGGSGPSIAVAPAPAQAPSSGGSNDILDALHKAYLAHVAQANNAAGLQYDQQAAERGIVPGAATGQDLESRLRAQMLAPVYGEYQSGIATALNNANNMALQREQLANEAAYRNQSLGLQGQQLAAQTARANAEQQYRQQALAQQTAHDQALLDWQRQQFALSHGAPSVQGLTIGQHIPGYPTPGSPSEAMTQGFAPGPQPSGYASPNSGGFNNGSMGSGFGQFSQGFGPGTPGVGPGGRRAGMSDYNPASPTYNPALANPTPAPASNAGLAYTAMPVGLAGMPSGQNSATMTSGPSMNSSAVPVQRPQVPFAPATPGWWPQR